MSDSGDDFYNFGGDNTTPFIPEAPPVEPKFPVAVVLVGGMVSCGLLAMTTSAYDAFQLATPNWFEAIAKAVLVEGSLIAESFVIMRRGGWERRALAFIGGAVSVGVSFGYNYLQAAAHNANQIKLGGQLITLADWQITALALGPIASLVSLGLVLGHLWNEYEIAKEEWDAWQRAETERKNIRAVVNSNNAVESDNLRKWQSAEAEKDRAHQERMAMIEKGIDPDAPKQTPQAASIDSQAPAVDPKLAALVAEFRASNASSKSISGDLCRYLHGLGYTNTQIATATGIHITGVGKHIKAKAGG